MKKCNNCNIKKKFEDFHVCKTTKDGRRSICKLCRNAGTRKYYSENTEKIAKKNKLRGRKYYATRNTEWNSKNKEKRLKYVRDWKSKNKHKVKAHNILMQAIKTGEVKRGKCEFCGNRKTHGHHEDYNKPLDVVWLCSEHHGKVHRKQD